MAIAWPLVPRWCLRTGNAIFRTGLQALLSQGLPLIVFVRTGELPYWSYQTDHAVVVVGYDEDHVYANDPDRSDAPIAVPVGDFELAWLERDYAYALVAPSEDPK